MPVINIDSSGRIKDGSSTHDQRTNVRQRATVTWNSEGGGPWMIVFTGLVDPNPLLDAEDIVVPRNGGTRGRSKNFQVSFEAILGKHYTYRVQSGATGAAPELAGPELIIDPGGGGILKGVKATSPTATATRTAAGRKTAPGTKTGRRKVALRKTARRTGAKRAKASAGTGRQTTARKTAARKAARTKRAAKKR